MKWGTGGVVLSREEHTNWMSSAKESALKTYTQVTVYRGNRYIWEYICVCVHVYNAHIHAISAEERDHDFDGEWRGVHGRVWREKGKGKML